MYGLLDMVTQCSLRGQTYSHNSLVALKGQIMTVKAHPGLCIKYSRWDILESLIRIHSMDRKKYCAAKLDIFFGNHPGPSP